MYFQEVFSPGFVDFNGVRFSTFEVEVDASVICIGDLSVFGDKRCAIR